EIVAHAARQAIRRRVDDRVGDVAAGEFLADSNEDIGTGTETRNAVAHSLREIDRARPTDERYGHGLGRRRLVVDQQIRFGDTVAHRKRYELLGGTRVRADCDE